MIFLQTLLSKYKTIARQNRAQYLNFHYCYKGTKIKQKY